MMENGLFLRAPHSTQLAKGFVEARLHVDAGDSPHINRILQIRDLYTGKNNASRPVYVIVDTKTEKKVREHWGAFSPDELRNFLKPNGSGG